MDVSIIYWSLLFGIQLYNKRESSPHISMILSKSLILLHEYFKIIFPRLPPTPLPAVSPINFLCGLRWVRGYRLNDCLLIPLEKFHTNLFPSTPTLIFCSNWLKQLHQFGEEFHWMHWKSHHICFSSHFLSITEINGLAEASIRWDHS